MSSIPLFFPPKLRRECGVLVEPVPKQRPRVTQHGTYTPKQTRLAETAVRMYWEAKYPDPIPATMPLRLTVFAVLKKPKSTKREWPIVQPDWDNLGKLVSDALNGTAYADDKQIVDGRCIKRYAQPGEEPHFWIILEEVTVHDYYPAH